MRFVIQYARSKALRVLRNAIKADDWKQMQEDIHSTSQDITKKIGDRVNARTLQIWESVEKIMPAVVNIYTTQQAILGQVDVSNDSHRRDSLALTSRRIASTTNFF